MFRLFFEPIEKNEERELMVLDKVYEDFNDFQIDLNRRVVRVNLKPNINNGIRTWEEMMSCLKEGWDIYKLTYRQVYPNGSLIEIDIPVGYNVRVILK
jgi:hypothetical protein